ncbi:MAG: FG-GAP repeat domain-containing protein, partial [Bacteroidota bacterium]
MLKKIALIILLCIGSHAGWAQFHYRLNTTGVRVFDGNFEIESPFWGGFNSPQFQPFDLNGDKSMDVIVFDRYDSKILPFVRLNNSDVFQYAPEYTARLPKGLYYYKTADLNADGEMDIFTLSESSNLLIYINRTTPGSSNLKFQDLGPWYYRNQYDSTQPIQYNPLSFSKFDMPEISDIDGDGDLDILSYDQGNYTYRLFKDV